MERRVARDNLSPDLVVLARKCDDPALNYKQPFQAFLVWDEITTQLDIIVQRGFEAGIVLEGRVLRQFEDVSYIAGPGDIWLCSMWEPYGWAVLDGGLTAVVVVFLPEFLGDENFDGVSWLSMFAISPKERPRVTTSELRKEILAIGHDLGREIADKLSGWTMAVRLNLLKAFLLLNRNWKPPSPARKLRSSDLSLIAPALNLFQPDPSRVVRVSQAAKECGLSESGFARKFKHAMGMTFHRYQLRAKLGFVAKRLAATDLSLETIALDAGFVDRSHLIHVFEKYYACTPGEYRRKVQSPGADRDQGPGSRDKLL